MLATPAARLCYVHVVSVQIDCYSSVMFDTADPWVLQLPFSLVYSMLLQVCMQIYFRDGCLRHPASTCLNSTNVFYPMTNHGLNLLTYYFLDQADRLANDSAADVNAYNSRFQFIWEVRSCTACMCQDPQLPLP